MTAEARLASDARAVHVARLVQFACLLEASAPKPGNVSPGRRFGDMGFEHFLASAVAVGEPFRHVSSRPLGDTIRDAVQATSQWTRSNTNLGIVLLLAPLARAAALDSSAPSSARRRAQSLREALASVLAGTTVEDARGVYEAIRQASPGGLGRVAEQDVADGPSLPLVEVMRLAADRDDVAREYDTTFATTFDTGAPALTQALLDGLSWDDAIVETFLTVLAARRDTHVQRRAGAAAAADVSRRAAAALADGGIRTAAGRRTIAEMDVALRGPDNLLNPGTSADLTVAATFVVLVSGGWETRSGSGRP